MTDHHREVTWRKPWPTSRRGFKLWLVALMLGAKGVAYLVGDWEGTQTESALRLFTEMWHIPVEAFGAMMVALCLVAGATAYSRRGGDRYGYIILTAAAVGYAACFAVSPIFLDGPLAPSLQGGTTYMLAAALLLISAADPEPLNPDELAELAGLDVRSDEAHEATLLLSTNLHEADPNLPPFPFTPEHLTPEQYPHQDEDRP